MNCCTCRATFLRHYSWSKIKQCLDCGVDIPADTGVRDLGMRQAYLARIGQHRGIDFVIGANHDIDQAQDRAQDDAEGAGIIPLIWAEIDIQHHWHTCLVSSLGGKERCATTWFFAQTSTTNQESTAVRNRRCQHIINSQFDIGTIIAVVCQWEAVRRLNPQHHGTGTPPWFTWDKLCFYALTL